MFLGIQKKLNKRSCSQSKANIDRSDLLKDLRDLCIVQGHNDASSEAEVSESEPGTTRALGRSKSEVTRTSLETQKHPEKKQKKPHVPRDL